MHRCDVSIFIANWFEIHENMVCKAYLCINLYYGNRRQRQTDAQQFGTVISREQMLTCCCVRPMTSPRNSVIAKERHTHCTHHSITHTHNIFELNWPKVGQRHTQPAITPIWTLFLCETHDTHIKYTILLSHTHTKLLYFRHSHW